MQFSAQEEYGLRCLIRLASAGEGASVTIPEISHAEGISVPYVAKMMRALRDGGHEVFVRMTLTSPGCGMGDLIKEEVEEKLAELPDVERVRVEIVFDPPWTPDNMDDAAKLVLNIL